MDAEILSRIQFGFTAAFHYIYPPLSIGLGLILVIMEGLYLKTGNKKWHNLTKFWVGIFALTFGMGVATGIVLEFEFGTNWSTYSRFVGDIFGSALAAEGIFAFFLESGFLAVLVFGWDRVSPKMHFFSTCMVALGSFFSAIWILVANSWQQTPVAFEIREAANGQRAEITDFWAMVFNPSFVDRFTHTVMGCYLTGSLLVVSVAAFYLLKGRHTDYAKMSMKIGLVIATIAALGQLLLGHNSAVGVAENQPAKMAAMEGHYNSGEPMDLALIGWYDEEANEVKGISIPGAGTALLMWSPLDPFSIDMDTPVTGLDQFAEEDRPPVEPVFQSYHVMVAIGMFLIAMTLVASFMMFKGTLWTSKWMLSTLVGAVVLPHLANFTGWMTAEIGRQPWVVYNLLRTEDALSPAVSGGEVLTSLIMFALVYALLFSLFLYLLDKKIKGGPTEPDEHGLVEEERKAKVIGGEAS